MNQIPIHLLLIEDSPTDASLLRKVLVSSGKQEWQLQQVRKLSEAIAICEQGAIDLIFLDLNIPDSQNLETITKLHLAVPNIPIVVLAEAEGKLALAALNQGAQDYLVKSDITTPLLVKTISYNLERSKHLQKLEESEERFRYIIFENTLQLMALLTPEGQVLEINRASLQFCDSTKEEVINNYFWEGSAWNYSPKLQNWLQTAVTKAGEGNLVHQEIELQRARGGIEWIDFSLKPLKDKTGKVILLIAEGRNIDGQKKAEAKVKEALAKSEEVNELKSKVISTVSHEFRTPLTIIRSCTELLELYEGDHLEPKKRKNFQRIQASISQMITLLNDMLLVGQAEAGKLEFNPVPLDLVAFCRETLEQLKVRITNNQTIHFTSPQEQIRAVVDENLLGQILTNLLSNALKYSPEGETIDLRLSVQKEQAIFTIKDRGIGIPQKELNNLFDSFYRGSNVGNIQGTGLGLAIVQNALELQGGEIKVESELDKGTVFRVLLPLNHDQ
ncbi:MAG: ATP-binding protein [Spirulinaceae cyanobacterium]